MNIIRQLAALALFFTVCLNFICCSAIQKAETKLGITPAIKASALVVIKADAATAIADIVAHKSTSTILTDEAATTLASIADQARAQGGSSAVVAITDAGKAALADYVAKASTSTEVTDAGIAAVRSLINGSAATP